MIALMEGVSKSFTLGQEVVVALHEVDFTLAAGELAVVYGASGSGKTTMLNVLAGIEVSDCGQVTVAGQVLSGYNEGQRADVRLRHIGVVFQSNNLLAELSAAENVALPLMVRGITRARAGAAAQGALASVGLEGLGARLPALMSGGQRQRVGIARALAGEQEVIVADEPTGALDSVNSQHLFALLRRLCDERGTAVVLATHDPLARGVADSVHHIVDGCVSAL